MEILSVLSEKRIATLWDARGDLSERLMCEQTSEGSVASILHVREQSGGRETAKCKGPAERRIFMFRKGRGQCL